MRWWTVLVVLVVSGPQPVWATPSWAPLSGLLRENDRLSEEAPGGSSGEPAMFWGIPDTAASVGRLFHYPIPRNAFSGHISQYKVHEASSPDLPTWLYFNATSNSFLGVPSSLDQGAIAIDVTAVNQNMGQKEKNAISTHFIITIQATNEHPGNLLRDLDYQSGMDVAKMERTEKSNGLPQTCQWDQNAYKATLVLDANIQKLFARQRVDLLYKSAAFLSQTPARVSLGPRRSDSVVKLLDTRTVRASPCDLQGRSDNHGIELSWLVGCGEFTGLDDLAKVLEHNRQIGRIEEDLGLSVVGWMLTETLPPAPLRRLSRQKRQARAFHTLMPTRTLAPIMPSRVSQSSTFLVEGTVDPPKSFMVSTDIPSLSNQIFSSGIEASASSSRILPETSSSDIYTLLTTSLVSSTEGLSSGIQVSSTATDLFISASPSSSIHLMPSQAQTFVIETSPLATFTAEESHGVGSGSASSTSLHAVMPLSPTTVISALPPSLEPSPMIAATVTQYLTVSHTLQPNTTEAYTASSGVGDLVTSSHATKQGAVPGYSTSAQSETLVTPSRTVSSSYPSQDTQTTEAVSSHLQTAVLASVTTDPSLSVALLSGSSSQMLPLKTTAFSAELSDSRDFTAEPTESVLITTSHLTSVTPSLVLPSLMISNSYATDISVSLQTAILEHPTVVLSSSHEETVSFWKALPSLASPVSTGSLRVSALSSVYHTGSLNMLPSVVPTQSLGTTATSALINTSMLVSPSISTAPSMSPIIDTAPLVSNTITIAPTLSSTLSTGSSVSTPVNISPSVSTVSTAPSVSTVSTAPSVSAVSTAPSVSTVSTAPSVSTVSTAPSVPTVSTAPSVSTVSTAPSVSTVSTAPSVSTVSTAPSVSTVSTAPSAVSTAPSVSTVSTAPSVSTVSTAPSVSTVSTALSVSTVSTAPPVSTVSTGPSVSTVSTGPSVSSVSTAPAVSDVSTAPAVSIVSTAPAVSTSNTAPALSAVSTPPVVSTSNTAPAVSTLSTASTVSTVSTAPSVSTVSTAPSVSTVSTGPSVSTVSTAPSVSSVSTAPAVSDVSTAPAVSDVSTAPAVSDVSTAPAVSIVSTAPAVSTSNTAPAVSAVSTAPAVSTVTSAPTVSTVTTAPSVSTVSTAPAVSTVSTAPSVSTVSTTPSVSTVSTAPSVSTVSTALSVSTVSTAPSVSTVSTAPSVSIISIVPSMSITIGTAPSVSSTISRPIAPSVSTISTAPSLSNTISIAPSVSIPLSIAPSVSAASSAAPSVSAASSAAPSVSAASSAAPSVSMPLVSSFGTSSQFGSTVVNLVTHPPTRGQTLNVVPVTATDIISPVTATDIISPVTATDIMPPVTATDIMSPVTATDIISPVTATDIMPPVTATDIMPLVTATDIMSPVTATDIISPVTATDIMPPVTATDIMSPVTAADDMSLVTNTEDVAATSTSPSPGVADWPTKDKVSISLTPSFTSKTTLFMSLSPSNVQARVLTTSVAMVTSSIPSASSSYGEQVTIASTLSAQPTPPMSTLPSNTLLSMTTHSPSTVTMAMQTSVETMTTSKSVQMTTTRSNSAPVLVHPTRHIDTHLGVYFCYQVPEDTFYDYEDGNTRALKLHLLTLTMETLPLHSWVQFDLESQTIFGIPLKKNIPGSASDLKFVLVAQDSGGLEARDAIKITINVTSVAALSHQFMAIFDRDFISFTGNVANVIGMLQTVAQYFGDSSPTSMTVTELRMGSVELRWSNNTLSKKVCENETIQEFYEKIYSGGQVNPDFQRALYPRYPVTKVGVEYSGICVPEATVLPVFPRVVPSTSRDSAIYYYTVIPAVLVALLIFIIIVVLLCIHRHRRLAGRLLMDDEKPIFAKDRHPVLLENELELKDLNNQPKQPCVIKSDGSFTNPAFQMPDRHPPRPPPYRIQPTGAYGPIFHDITGVDGSPPPEYSSGSEPGIFARPPPLYRLPPPYTDLQRTTAN